MDKTFAERKPVHHTEAGSIEVGGCRITRGMDKWIVSCGGKFVAETDTYVEAEWEASSHLAGVRARVEELQAGLNARQEASDPEY